MDTVVVVVVACSFVAGGLGASVDVLVLGLASEMRPAPSRALPHAETAIKAQPVAAILVRHRDLSLMGIGPYSAEGKVPPQCAPRSIRMNERSDGVNDCPSPRRPFDPVAEPRHRRSGTAA